MDPAAPPPPAAAPTDADPQKKKKKGLFRKVKGGFKKAKRTLKGSLAPRQKSEDDLNTDHRRNSSFMQILTRARKKSRSFSAQSATGESSSVGGADTEPVFYDAEHAPGAASQEGDEPGSPVRFRRRGMDGREDGVFHSSDSVGDANVETPSTNDVLTARSSEKGSSETARPESVLGPLPSSSSPKRVRTKSRPMSKSDDSSSFEWSFTSDSGAEAMQNFQARKSLASNNNSNKDPVRSSFAEDNLASGDVAVRGEAEVAIAEKEDLGVTAASDHEHGVKVSTSEPAGDTFTDDVIDLAIAAEELRPDVVGVLVPEEPRVRHSATLSEQTDAFTFEIGSDEMRLRTPSENTSGHSDTPPPVSLETRNEEGEENVAGRLDGNEDEVVGSVKDTKEAVDVDGTITEREGPADAAAAADDEYVENPQDDFEQREIGSFKISVAESEEAVTDESADVDSDNVMVTSPTGESVESALKQEKPAVAEADLPPAEAKVVHETVEDVKVTSPTGESAESALKEEKSVVPDVPATRLAPAEVKVVDETVEDVKVTSPTGEAVEGALKQEKPVVPATDLAPAEAEVVDETVEDVKITSPTGESVEGALKQKKPVVPATDLAPAEAEVVDETVEDVKVTSPTAELVESALKEEKPVVPDVPATDLAPADPEVVDETFEDAKPDPVSGYIALDRSPKNDDPVAEVASADPNLQIVQSAAEQDTKTSSREDETNTAAIADQQHDRVIENTGDHASNDAVNEQENKIDSTTAGVPEAQPHSMASNDEDLDLNVAEVEQSTREISLQDVMAMQANSTSENVHNKNTEQEARPLVTPEVEQTVSGREIRGFPISIEAAEVDLEAEEDGLLSDVDGMIAQARSVYSNEHFSVENWPGAFPAQNEGDGVASPKRKRRWIRRLLGSASVVVGAVIVVTCLH